MVSRARILWLKKAIDMLDDFGLQPDSRTFIPTGMSASTLENLVIRPLRLGYAVRHHQPTSLIKHSFFLPFDADKLFKCRAISDILCGRWIAVASDNCAGASNQDLMQSTAKVSIWDLGHGHSIGLGAPYPVTVTQADGCIKNIQSVALDATLAKTASPVYMLSFATERIE
jgi:hypothetical protein